MPAVHLSRESYKALQHYEPLFDFTSPQRPRSAPISYNTDLDVIYLSRTIPQTDIESLVAPYNVFAMNYLKHHTLFDLDAIRSLEIEANCTDFRDPWDTFEILQHVLHIMVQLAGSI
jgi:hypothetical protein